MIKEWDKTLSELGVDHWNKEVCGQLTLYWQEKGDHSFEFKVLEWSTELTDSLKNTVKYFEVVAYGVAYFDGVRHLNILERREGYLYYPNTQSWALLFAKLRQLEVQVCNVDFIDDEVATDDIP